MSKTIAEIFDVSTLKLGKRDVRTSVHTPVLRHYFAADIAPPPAAADWGAAAKLPWGMLLNDQIGDCTAAAVGHACQTWSANTTGEVPVTDAETISFYSSTTGYNPADPATDQGGVELDVLQWWQANSFAGYKIDSLAQVDFGNQTNICQAIYLMGGIYVGLQLPVTAQTQTVWDYPPGGPTGNGAPGSWGGHAVWVLGYDAKGLTCITWGKVWKMTWAFVQLYMDECYACLSPLWYASKTPPNGFDVNTLKQDMAQMQANDPITQDPSAPGMPPVATAGPLLELKVGNLTLDISQAFANLMLVALGTALFVTGHDCQTVSAWIGAAIALVSGAAHLKNIHGSNQDTRSYIQQVMGIIGLLKSRRPH